MVAMGERTMRHRGAVVGPDDQASGSAGIVRAADCRGDRCLSEWPDLSDDWMISGKVKVKEFLFGMQMWETREGTASSSTQWAEPGARNGNVWVPRQTSFYARYSTALPGNLRLSCFGQAKVHELKPESSAFMLQSYVTGPLGWDDLLIQPYLSGTARPEAFWMQTRLAQSSNQVRNEMNLSYRARNNLSLVGGVDLRHGSLQTDYSQSSNCTVEPLPDVRIPETLDPLTLFETRSDQDLYLKLLTRLIDRSGAFLGYESYRPRCTSPSSLVLEPVDGGEHRAARDIGVFAQSSFNPVPDIKLVAGLRIDNGHVTRGSSYGTVVTPRLAVVYITRPACVQGDLCGGVQGAGQPRAVLASSGNSWTCVRTDARACQKCRDQRQSPSL